MIDWEAIGRALLLYDPRAPLLFPTLEFWVWLTLLMGFYGLLLQKKAYQAGLWTLLVFSVFFYYKSTGTFVLIFLGTLGFSYLTTRQMVASQKESSRKAWLTVSILIPLLFLGYYKYTNFLIDTANALGRMGWKNLDIFLPAGISFYTFQMVSYAVDVYRGEVKPASFRDYALYIAFFPQLVAGPIVRASHFLPQIEKISWPDATKVSSGLWLILQGLIKKVVLADYIAQYNDLIFGNPRGYSGFENLMAIYGYGLQIFCDFSGYSDIAIGIGRMMGFDLGINFDKPYRSASITEFWRRWHISLSSWLRDYLYIPLGGNRRGRVRTYLNLLLTMLIGGLWHGASWRFVVWGGLHGVALAVHRVLGGKVEPPKPLWRRILGWFITFHFVLLLWVFFRAKDFETAMQVFAQLRNVDIAYAMPFVEVRPLLVGLLGIGYGLHFMPMRWVQAVEARFIRLPWAVQLVVFILTVQLILQMRQAYVQPFIYFQF